MDNKSLPPPTHTPSAFPTFNMMTMPNAKLPLACRPKTADEWTIKAVFLGKEYQLPLKNFQPKFILDCGANVGYTSVYFANIYPNADIVSVEPELGNYKMLTFNTNFYDNIKCIRAAIWNKVTYIKIVDAMSSVTGFMTFDTTADDPNALKTTTIAKLLSESSFNEIDILKVDIEGAEKEVFGADDVDEWLSKVKVLVIELHDRMKRGCSRALFGAVSRYDFFFSQVGPNQIFIREDISKELHAR